MDTHKKGVGGEKQEGRVFLGLFFNYLLVRSLLLAAAAQYTRRTVKLHSHRLWIEIDWRMDGTPVTK